MHTLKRRDFFKRIGKLSAAAIAAPVVAETIIKEEPKPNLIATSVDIKTIPRFLTLSTTPATSNERIKVRIEQDIEIGEPVAINAFSGLAYPVKFIDNFAIGVAVENSDPKTGTVVLQKFYF